MVRANVPIAVVQCNEWHWGLCHEHTSVFFNEQIEIAAHAIENLKKAGMEARFTDKLAAVQQKGSFKYLQLGEVLKQTFTLEKMEEIIAFSTARNIPLYKVVNGNFVVMHGGEYGLILALYPSKKTVVVRYLGERWGRQQKEDGTGYKYLIDKEIIVHMIRLTSELQ